MSEYDNCPGEARHQDPALTIRRIVAAGVLTFGSIIPTSSCTTLHGVLNMSTCRDTDSAVPIARVESELTERGLDPYDAREGASELITKKSCVVAKDSDNKYLAVDLEHIIEFGNLTGTTTTTPTTTTAANLAK